MSMDSDGRSSVPGVDGQLSMSAGHLEILMKTDSLKKIYALIL